MAIATLRVQAGGQFNTVGVKRSGQKYISLPLGFVGEQQLKHHRWVPWLLPHLSACGFCCVSGAESTEPCRILNSTWDRTWVGSH